MTSVIEMSHILMQAHAALVETLVIASQGVDHAPKVSLPHFHGRPQSPSDPTTDEWLSHFDVFVRQCGVPEGERAVGLVDYLGGCAKEEVLCHPDEVSPGLRRGSGVPASESVWAVGDRDVTDLYSRMQSEGETLAEYSRALIRLHQRIEGAAPGPAVLGDGALKHQFVVGVRDEWVRHELRRLMFRLADKPFIVVREEAPCLMCEEEASVVDMHPMAKAAPALSGPVGGSVSYVRGLDAAVLGDGGMTANSGDVGRYVSVGDVSCGGDMELRVVLTRWCHVLSLAVCVTLTGCQEVVTRI